MIRIVIGWFVRRGDGAVDGHLFIGSGGGRRRAGSKHEFVNVVGERVGRRPCGAVAVVT